MSILMLPFGYDTNKILLIALTAAFSTLPDIDLQWQRQGIPIHHRGPTHSILFASLVGIFFGIVFWYGFKEAGWFFIGFLSGVIGIISHMLGDSLTYMSFKPLWPFSPKEVSLGLCRASNRLANEGFMTIGIFSFIGYILVGQGSVGIIWDSIKPFIDIL